MGVTGNTAIHLREPGEKEPKIWEIYVDVGASSDKEVAELGLRVGDGPMLMNENKLVCRALDNRLSGFILSEIARKLCKLKKPVAWNVVLVNAVQEEVGCIGAGMITHRLRPDAAICIDVTHATDSPGLDKGIPIWWPVWKSWRTRIKYRSSMKPPDAAPERIRTVSTSPATAWPPRWCPSPCATCILRWKRPL